MTKIVIAAALGDCIYVAGVSSFLRLAETAGWKTIFLGPAAPIEAVLESARRVGADLQPGDQLLVGVFFLLSHPRNRRTPFGAIH